MKTKNHIFSLFILIAIILVSCDNRRIYEKSALTNKPVVKQMEDTIVITDQNKFAPLLLAQKKEQATFLFYTDDVDSIYQTNYWLKKENDAVIQTRKRLDRTIMKYKNGRLNSTATYQIDGDLSLSQQYYFDYDGLLLAKHETNSALNLVEEQFVYSKDNLVIGKVHSNGKGKNVAHSTVVYSPSDNRYIEIINWHISETQSKIEKQYDSKGNLNKEFQYQALMNHKLTDTTEQVFEHQYDKSGRLTMTNQYNTWGMILNYKEALYLSTRFEYDSIGNVNLVIETKANGEMRAKYSTTYQYDSKNNWTEKMTFKNGQPESKLERVIYYNTIGSL